MLELQRAAESLGLSKYQRHIFLCADQTEPKCCDNEAGLASWDFLKRRLKELGLVGPGIGQIGSADLFAYGARLIIPPRSRPAKTWTWKWATS